MGEALAKIHHREEAAVRRERAMAYAFTHQVRQIIASLDFFSTCETKNKIQICVQWRANSTPSFGSGNQELSKASWGWSWMDRWIAARPWESRVAAVDSPKNAQTRQPNKAVKTTTTPISKAPEKIKLISPNGKAARKGRRLSYEAAAVKKMNMKIEEKKTKNAKESS